MNCTECQDLFCKHRSQSTAGGQCFYESKEQTEKLLAAIRIQQIKIQQEMKAPDKIYLEKSLSNPNRLHSQWYPYDVLGGGIEYIRKDFLLEWLESKVYEHNEDRFDDGFNTAIGQVIDKINLIVNKRKERLENGCNESF